MAEVAAVVGKQRRGTVAARTVTAGMVGFAALLSAYMIVLVLAQPGGTAIAAAAAVAMTAPVVLARRSPTTAAFLIAAATAVNELLFPHLVRCGPGLPAVFFVAFCAGSCLGRKGYAALAGTALSITLQCIFDPRLGAGVTAMMIPIDVGFFAGGRYVHHRAAMVSELRSLTSRLHDQRERTADLAVVADRQNLSAVLNRTLRQRIEMLESVTLGGEETHDRFVAIEQLGRETLERMRELLGSIRSSPTRPEPRIADLPEVCARATNAVVHLTVKGAARPLPDSVELSVCRIVEQLLRQVPDEATAHVDVTITLHEAGVDILLRGLLFVGAAVTQPEALAQARAALHGGSVTVTADGRGSRAHAWLPLVTADV